MASLLIPIPIFKKDRRLFSGHGPENKPVIFYVGVGSKDLREGGGIKNKSHKIDISHLIYEKQKFDRILNKK